MDWFRFVIAGLCCYRIAQLFSYDNGPFFVLEKIRAWVDTKHHIEQQNGVEAGFYASLNEWMRCPYCQGIWVSVFVGILVLYPTMIGDMFLTIGGIAGLQSRLNHER